MKKELIVGVFLALLLTTSFINIHFLRKLTDEVADGVESAVSAAQASNWSDAERKAEQAVGRWTGSDGYTHLVLRHSEVEAATDALYGFAEQIYARDSGAARGAGQAAMARVRSISDIERVRPGSIF